MNEKITKVSLDKLKTMKGNTHWAKLVAEEKAENKSPATLSNRKNNSKKALQPRALRALDSF